MKVKRICEWCGRKFEVFPSIIKYGGGKFCSRKCKDKAHKKRIKRICRYCGKEFETYPIRIKRGWGKFCSHKCQYQWRSEHMCGKNNPRWNRTKCICKQCGKEFEIIPSEIKKGKGKFCSNKCCAESKKTKIKRTCEQCGKIFEVHLCHIKRGGGKYCSISCSRKAQFFPKHHTKPELVFEQICKKNNLPFKYTGDGSFWIHNINPDFVECNGKKIAVEIFGDYWHSPLLNYGLKEDRTLLYRKKILKKYGWKLIVFWQTDLLREDAEPFIINILSQNGIIDNQNKK